MTLVCQFPHAILISVEFQFLSNDGDHYFCNVEAKEGGSCNPPTGSSCLGYSVTCSSNRINYTLTIPNVTDQFHGMKIRCGDSVDSRIKSPYKKLYLNG